MSTQRQMESLAACRWAETSTIPARPSSAAVFEQSLFKGNQRTLRKIYDNWRIRSILESRVANESVSKSATCFFTDNFTLPARTISGLYKCRRRAQGAAIAPPADYVHQQGRVLTTFRNALRQLFHARNLEGAVVDTVMHGGGYRLSNLMFSYAIISSRNQAWKIFQEHRYIRRTLIHTARRLV